jgi:hypothetical protein
LTWTIYRFTTYKIPFKAVLQKRVSYNPVSLEVFQRKGDSLPRLSFLTPDTLEVVQGKSDSRIPYPQKGV